MYRLMNSDEVAILLQVDVVTIRRLINKGELTAYKVGAEYRFQQSDIEDYLQRQCIPARESEGRSEKLFLGTCIKQIRTLMQLPSEKSSPQNPQITKQGYNVLELAKEEALRLNHNYISTEHLLVGLFGEGEGVAAKILQSMELTQGQARSRLEQIIGRGDGIVDSMDFTPELEKVLALAMREAQQRKQSNFGTEHLLLGLLRQGNNIGLGILEEISRLDWKQLRTHLLVTIDEYHKNGQALEAPFMLAEMVPSSSQKESWILCPQCQVLCPHSFLYCYNCGLYLRVKDI